MNDIERDCVKTLEILKKNFGVFEIKAEFEAEGSRMEEMMRLKEVLSFVDLPLILKIGGAEAVTDVYNAVIIGVKGMIAPMVETAYAVSKYLNVIEKFIQPDNRKDIEFAINIETITAYNNLNEIFALQNFAILSGITLGRSDFSGSVGLTKKDVNSPEMLKIAKVIARKCKDQGIKFAMGGNITKDSISFIKELHQEGIINKFETRKVVFDANIINNDPEAAIALALKFELLWLKSKQRFYSRIKEEDITRIADLEVRLG